MLVLTEAELHVLADQGSRELDEPEGPMLPRTHIHPQSTVASQKSSTS